MSEHSDHLVRLGELSGYKVADGDPDPRGWDVVTGDGRRVGRVDDLIVDREAERAQYLDVELSEGGDRHVLIPTDAVHLGEHERQRQQVAVGASAEYLSGVTPYRGLPLTPEQEAEYRSCPVPGGSPFARSETRIRRGETDHG